MTVREHSNSQIITQDFRGPGGGSLKDYKITHLWVLCMTGFKIELLCLVNRADDHNHSYCTLCTSLSLKNIFVDFDFALFPELLLYLMSH